MDPGTLFATFIRHSGAGGGGGTLLASASKGSSKQEEYLGSWERQREGGPRGSLWAEFRAQQRGVLASDGPSEYAKQPHVRICRLGTTAGALLFLGQSEAKEDGGGESEKGNPTPGGPGSPPPPPPGQGWTLLTPPVSARLGRGRKGGFEQGWHNASPQL